MNSSVSVCPVPFDQRPINEYHTLKESWLFRWVTLDLKAYLSRIVWFWSLSWSITGPIAAASFPPLDYPGKFALTAAAGASLVLASLLLRLYLGWLYIYDRLLSETVFYEETGWYDGQLWVKPPEVLVKDRLIGTYQVQPMLQRLRRTFSLLGLFLLAGWILWRLI
jgi:hypothetical protein